MYTIYALRTDSACQFSKKKGETLVVSNDKHGLDRAQLSVETLLGFMRLDAAQADNGSPRTPPVVNKVVSKTPAAT